MFVKLSRRVGCYKLNKFFFSNGSYKLNQVTSSGKTSTELLTLMNDMKIEDKNLPEIVKAKSNITK